MNARISAARVGGLAVALGIGVAVGTGCAVAHADPTGGAADPASASASEAGPATDPAADPSPRGRGADAAPAKSGTPPRDRTPLRIGLPDPTEAAGKSTPRNRRSPAADRVPSLGNRTAAPNPGPPPAQAQVSSLPETPTEPARTPRAIPAAVARSAAAEPAATVVALPAAVNVPVAAVMTTEKAPAALPAPLPAAASTAGGVVGNLLAAFGIGPLAANSPAAPIDTPALWGLMAWARREFQRTSAIPAAPRSPAVPTLSTDVVAPMAASVPLAAVAAVAPTTTPVAWVTGSGTGGPYLLKRTNNTAAMFGIAGTDLGIMWDNGIADNPATAVNEHQVLIAFGDTFSGLNQSGNWRSNTLLRTSDQNLADGITVPAGVAGNIFSGSPLSAPNLARQFIKSPGYLGFQGSEVTIIPTSGISVPYKNTYGARQYVSYMSVKSWDTPGRWTTNYAAIAYSDDNGQTWTVAPSTIRSAAPYRTTTGYVSGNQNFQQSAFVRPPAGGADADYLYVYGTPSGRGGTVYLSRVKQASVLDQAQYQYWDGANWVANKPSVAKPVLPGTTTTSWLSTRTSYPSAGEMSVQYNTHLNKYLMMYTDAGNNVVMRTADQPQGPWSAPTTLVTSSKYPGLYAPMMSPSSTGQDVYWNMSLWGDYNVLLMRTRLV